MPAKMKPTVANGINPADHDALVIYWAKKHGAKPPIRDSNQYADGWLGLLKACRLYDPTRGFSFATYASISIRNTIRKGFAPQLTQRCGSGKIKTYKFSQMQCVDGDSQDRESFMELNVRQSDHVSMIHDVLTCDHFLRFLPIRERDLVRMHFLDGLTMEEIADAHNPRISLSRVQQIISRSIKKLRIKSGIESKE